MKYTYYLCLDFQFRDAPMAEENQNCQESKQNVGESPGIDISKRRSSKCC